MESTEKEKKNKRGVFIAWLLFGVSITGNVALLYMLNTTKKEVVTQIQIIEKTIQEKNEVQKELLSLKDEYANLQTTDAAVQKEIEEKKALIDELIKEAEKHKGDASIIAKLRKETETLRSIMKGFVRTIDSLNTLNQQLIVEKKEVLTSLSKEKEKTVELSKMKDEMQATINRGSILGCSEVVVNGINLKSGGKKQVTTKKAKRADVIRVSFNLSENKIAKSGSKDVYVRIITPDGKEMAKAYDESTRFKFNGSAGYFAGRTNISYNNQAMGVTVLCEGNEALIPGKYQIEITCDGAVVGQSELNLE